MEKAHKEILGLMGKIDIDCRDEKDAIIIDLVRQLDIYNSHDITFPTILPCSWKRIEKEGSINSF